MSDEKEYDFEKQFFEEHGRYPTDDEVMEWVVYVIAQYREEDAVKSINHLITEEYADCVSEAVLLGNRWDDGDKYIIVKTALSRDEERFEEMSKKIIELFGMQSTHVLTYDYYDSERYYLEIYDDFEDGKEIYPEIYNSPLGNS